MSSNLVVGALLQSNANNIIKGRRNMSARLIIRRTWRVIPVLALSLLGLKLIAADEPQKENPTPEEIAKAETQVQKELVKLKGENGQVKLLASEPLVRTFPNHLFCSVLYRRYPVARVPPRPLKPSSIFAIRRAREGKPLLLADSKQLEDFFQEVLAPVQSDDQAKDTVRAWLRLSQILVQDGFYKFTLMDDSTKVKAVDSGKEASGKVVVMAGGNGEIDVHMTFDKSGKLIKLDQSVQVKPGPRPICQAYKVARCRPDYT